MFSCESCLPFPQNAVFLVFPFNPDTHKLTCKKEAALLSAAEGPQIDVKLTARRQQEWLSPPSWNFFVLK